MKILAILSKFLVFIIFFSSLFGEEGSTSEFRAPGFKGVFRRVDKIGHTFPLNLETLKKYDHDLKNYQPDEDFIRILFENFKRIIDECWHLINDLNIPPDLKSKMFDEKYKSAWNLVMSWCAGPDPEGWTEYYGNVCINANLFQQLLWAIIDDLKSQNGDGLVDLDKIENIVLTFFHEMLHAFGKYSGMQEDECIAHCLTRQVFPDHDPRKYEDGTGFPLHCNTLHFNKDIKDKMGEGNCFCKVNWKNRTPEGDKECQESSGTGLLNPGGNGRKPTDPDDNYSYYDGKAFQPSGYVNQADGGAGESGFVSDFYYSYYPNFLIYNKFNLPDIVNLLQRYIGDDHIDDYEHDSFLSEHKVLVIPSGELMGDSNSELIREGLKRFVQTGNTLLVLGQAYGSDYEKLIPVPEGESLLGYGWVEDQMCSFRSSYFKDIHPVLSGQTDEMVSVCLDGYFYAYPSNSTVLLRKSANNEPVLLYYACGEGTVILTSTYTDWGLAHSQVTPEESRLFRNLLTFAQDPKSQIPLFDISTDANPGIDMDVQIKNLSDKSASKFKIKVSNPSRTRVFFETSGDLSLIAGAETTVEISFQALQVTENDLGICHTDYELYDADGNLIQLSTEADSGRFAFYKIINHLTKENALHNCWVTAKEYDINNLETFEFTIHFKNNTDTTWTVSKDDPFLSVLHCQDIPIAPFNLNVDPHSEVDHTITVPAAKIAGVDISGDFTIVFFNGRNDQVSFGNPFVVYVREPTTTSLVKISNIGPLRFDEPINYQVNVSGVPSEKLGNVNIKFTMIGMGIYNDEKVVEEIFDINQDFSVDPVFNYSGNVLPKNFPYAKYYLLKLVVTNPNISRETKAIDLPYASSRVEISDFIIEGDSLTNGKKQLTAGQEYSARFKLKNSGPYKIENGKYDFSVKRIAYSGNPVTVFSKIVDQIPLNVGEQREYIENFNFEPDLAGDYFFQIEYYDETQVDYSHKIDKSQTYFYKLSTKISFDKEIYYCRENANINVTIKGSGPLKLDFVIKTKVADQWTNVFEENRDIVIPDGSDAATEIFQVQVPFISGGMYGFWVEAIARDEAKLTSADLQYFHIKPVLLNVSSILPGTTLLTGTQLDFKVKVTHPIDFILPIPANLKVSSQTLSFSEIRPVEIIPNGNNEYIFSIPLPKTLTAGNYLVDTELFFNEIPMEYLQTNLIISPPGMSLPRPPAVANAGDSLTLDFTNPGGKDGQYSIDVVLKDSFGVGIAQKSAVQAINAGEKFTLDFPVPADLGSGRYGLYLNVGEALTSQSFKGSDPIQVNGLQLSLNAHTIKADYFSSETVSGLAEIAGGGLTAGRLREVVLLVKTV